MHNQNYSFVVRVWLESLPDDEKIAIWRGSIERVGSDSRFYFTDLDGIAQFIQTQIGLEKKRFPSPWQHALESLRNGIRKFGQSIYRRQR